MPAGICLQGRRAVRVEHHLHRIVRTRSAFHHQFILLLCMHVHLFHGHSASNSRGRSEGSAQISSLGLYPAADSPLSPQERRLEYRRVVWHPQQRCVPPPPPRSACRTARAMGAWRGTARWGGVAQGLSLDRSVCRLLCIAGTELSGVALWRWGGTGAGTSPIPVDVRGRTQRPPPRNGGRRIRVSGRSHALI